MLPISVLRSADVEARISSDSETSQQSFLERSSDPGRFDVTTTARAELEGFTAETSATFASVVGPAGVAADLRLDSLLAEGAAGGILASTGGVVRLDLVFEVSEATPFRLSGLARASDLLADVVVRLSDPSAVLFELEIFGGVDPDDPHAGFDEPFAVSGSFEPGVAYQLLLVGVDDVFLPTTGALDLAAELLLVPEPGSGGLLLGGLLLLAACHPGAGRVV